MRAPFAQPAFVVTVLIYRLDGSSIEQKREALTSANLMATGKSAVPQAQEAGRGSPVAPLSEKKTKTMICQIWFWYISCRQCGTLHLFAPVYCGLDDKVLSFLFGNSNTPPTLLRFRLTPQASALSAQP